MTMNIIAPHKQLGVVYAQLALYARPSTFAMLCFNKRFPTSQLRLVQPHAENSDKPPSPQHA